MLLQDFSKILKQIYLQENSLYAYLRGLHLLIKEEAADADKISTPKEADI